MPKPLNCIVLGFLCFLIPGLAWSQESSIDRQLREIQERFQLKPLPILPDRSQQPLFLLGESLYFEKEISGNRNIACASCHHPGLGTSDGLPISLGQGNDFLDSQKPRRSNGAVLRRSSPSLFNLGYVVSEHMFWDSRVNYDAKSKQFSTPSEFLNGSNPSLSNVTALLPNALAAQVLFPMVDHLEMKGQAGENEIADASDEKEAWQAIIDRILNIERYRPLLTRAYPEIPFPDDFNIGHLAKALGYYIESAFSTPNTPYDAYLRGDHSQMSLQEKKGMVVFFSSGGCFRCHNGPLLTKQINVNIGIPVIKATQNSKPDQGRFEITGDQRDKYAFKVPGLRNVALSAPYMHNGAFATLEEVVEHYSGPLDSIRHYELPKNFGENLGESSFHYDKKATAEVANTLDFRVSGRLKLSKKDKDNLVAFLKNSLTGYPSSGGP